MQRLTDEYRLIRRLGSGGMGEVWEGARVKTADIVVPCAIKLLHVDFTDSEREQQLFYDEARIATQLDHSRIVKITDVGTADDGRPFLVMERVDGVDLRHFLKAAARESGTPLDLDVVTYIVGEVLAGLAYAHSRTVGGSDGGIIHSDVTPGNVLISSCGEVKLTDFGIARFSATAGPMSRAIGTPRYMSPEQLSGNPLRETDIYGLGVILHELLEGERFLDGLTPEQFRVRVLTGPPPELKREGIPAWLDELRAKMIATEPRDRPQAAEARELLVGNCPGYAAAAAVLEADYAKWIGGRRSGVTHVFDAEAASASARPPEQEVAPTELLPTTSESRPTSEGTSSAATEPPGASPSMRWLALASAVTALAFMLLSLALVVKMLREPSGQIDTGGDESADATSAGETSKGVSDDTSQETETGEPAETGTGAPAETEGGTGEPAETETGEPAETETGEPAKTEGGTEGGTETGGLVEVKPKPKALPKVGVLFFVESKVEGRLKAGRKVIEIKNRSGYVELPVGRYKLSWQPAGSDEWQSHGKVTLEDIRPKRYKIRLAGGKISEFAQI